MSDFAVLFRSDDEPFEQESGEVDVDIAAIANIHNSTFRAPAQPPIHTGGVPTLWTIYIYI